MKHNFLNLLLILTTLTNYCTNSTFAQEVTENLKFAKVEQIGSGLLMSGTKNTRLVVIKYNSDLKEIGRYEKDLGFEPKTVETPNGSSMHYEFKAYQNNWLTEGIYIKLDTLLKEASSTVFDKNTIQIGQEEDNNFYPDQSSYLSIFQGNKVIAPTEKGALFGTYAKSLYYSRYKIDSRTDFGLDGIHSNEIIYCDNNYIVFYVNQDFGDRKLQQNIVCCDILGKILFKIKLNEVTKNIFAVSKCHFDGDSFYLFGDFTDLKDKKIIFDFPIGVSFDADAKHKETFRVKMDSFFIIKINKNGEIKASQKYPFSDAGLASNKQVRKLIYPEFPLMVFQKIIIRDGKKIAVAENLYYSQDNGIDTPGNSYNSWRSIGFTIIDFSNLENVSSTFIPKTKEELNHCAEKLHFNSLNPNSAIITNSWLSIAFPSAFSLIEVQFSKSYDSYKLLYKYTPDEMTQTYSIYDSKNKISTRIDGQIFLRDINSYFKLLKDKEPFNPNKKKELPINLKIVPY